VALAGALLLVFVVLVRPQEFVPALHAFGVLNVLTALAVLGIATEVVLGKQTIRSTPQMPWLAAFVVWCFLVTVRRLGRDGLTAAWDSVGLSAIFMLVVMFAITTEARWRALAAMLVAVGVLVSGTCIHQSQQPAECIAIDTSGALGERSGEGEPDGRSCDNTYVCEQNGKEHVAYACEKVGLFGTFTEGWRVRWRGTLGDPNELALLLGALMPLSFAFASASPRHPKLAKLAALIALGLSMWCVVLTGSRGGQLVVVTVFGVYFVRRYGFKGLVAGAILALPVLLFGGRAGEEAESSSLERIDLLYDGMDLIRSYPILGVGTGQFIEHTWNALTAHNSYVLAAAELGLPGSLLWLMLVYTSIKIPWVVATRPPPGLEGFVPFARGLVVAFAAILVGVFFLSFCYKAVLFVFFGMSGAMYRVAQRACPSFEVRVTAKEVAHIAVADAAMLVFVLVYSHFAVLRA